MLHEQSAAAARNAKEQVKSWQSMLGEIESAEGTLVSDLIGRRKSPVTISVVDWLQSGHSGDHERSPGIHDSDASTW
jgi:hypothetical protein